MSQDFGKQVDGLLAEAMTATQGGVDLTLSMQMMAEAQQALLEIVQSLRMSDIRRAVQGKLKCECPACGKTVTMPYPNVEQLAKAGMQVMKIVDESARLNQFVKGLPDSRQAVETTNWLAGLTRLQVETVQGWIEANAEAGDLSAGGHAQAERA